MAQRLAIKVFFADPYRSRQRGTNESTNGLLRQYLPKGTDLSGYTQRELNAIAHRLNTRPRKCLDCATPLEVYAHLRPHSPVALGTYNRRSINGRLRDECLNVHQFTSLAEAQHIIEA